jgi:hypothetical protein
MDLVAQNIQETHDKHLSHKNPEKDKDHLPLDGAEIEETGAQFNSQEDQQIDKREETQHAGRKKIDKHSEKEGKDTGPRSSGINQQVPDHDGNEINVSKMESCPGDQASLEKNVQDPQKPDQSCNGYSFS